MVDGLLCRCEFALGVPVVWGFVVLGLNVALAGLLLPGVVKGRFFGVDVVLGREEGTSGTGNVVRLGRGVRALVGFWVVVVTQ